MAGRPRARVYLGNLATLTCFKVENPVFARDTAKIKVAKRLSFLATLISYFAMLLVIPMASGHGRRFIISSAKEGKRPKLAKNLS
jgi:hypothetical protein